MAIGRDRREPQTGSTVGRTRKALKEALTDLILEKGYEGVTVQDVIDRADVGRSTFYAHFVDKDDLLMAILADLEMPGLDPSTWKPDDPAFGWTLALFRHFGSGKRLFKAVASSQSGRSPPRDDRATRGAWPRPSSRDSSATRAARRVPAPDRRPIPRRNVHRLHGLVDARGERAPAGGAGRPRLSRRSSCRVWRRSSSWSSSCPGRSDRDFSRGASRRSRGRRTPPHPRPSARRRGPRPLRSGHELPGPRRGRGPRRAGPSSTPVTSSRR